MIQIDPIIRNYQPISLEEMDRVKLLNRTDTKFVMPIEKLPALLEKAAQYYQSIEIDNNRMFTYRTLYYDTENFDMYYDHHRGKLNRYKVRYREYRETQMGFMEVKFKSNKERTIKTRIRKDEVPNNLSKQALDFVNAHTPYNAIDLQPKLWNEFKRLTLVHKTNQERLTIDFGLKFTSGNNQAELPYVAIIELKQDKFSVSSDFYKLLREERIQPSGMSKYATGVVLLNKGFKHNRFKANLKNLEKINNDYKYANIFNRN